MNPKPFWELNQETFPSERFPVLEVAVDGAAFAGFFSFVSASDFDSTAGSVGSSLVAVLVSSGTSAGAGAVAGGDEFIELKKFPNMSSFFSTFVSFWSSFFFGGGFGLSQSNIKRVVDVTRVD